VEGKRKRKKKGGEGGGKINFSKLGEKKKEGKKREESQWAIIPKVRSRTNQGKKGGKKKKEENWGPASSSYFPSRRVYSQNVGREREGKKGGKGGPDKRENTPFSNPPRSCRTEKKKVKKGKKKTPIISIPKKKAMDRQAPDE